MVSSCTIPGQDFKKTYFLSCLKHSISRAVHAQVNLRICRAVLRLEEQRLGGHSLF